ncbi:DUF1573 domain-containing protein [Flavobacterium sp.]|jgi:hypothetical protein|uniref:DUF1573 domain-containing protein n=1 Tax=Flavobacterium sp. TaxID=239 RepID=UPI002A8149E0|nr:DUF1573 domain-containing protein [Flavobacterium sp.]
MLKKTFSLALLVITLVSCNLKGTSKITDQDMKSVEAEKALIGKFPKIELDKIEHDFGTINEGDIVETVFIVKNTGDSDLIIADAKGSCGCTVPEPPKEPIAPGQSAPIKVSFNSSGKPGQQNKTVTLTTNTESGNETFNIKADVTPKTGKEVPVTQ